MPKNILFHIPRVAIIRSLFLTRKIFHLSRYYVDNLISKLLHNDAFPVVKENSLMPAKKNLCIFSHYDPHNKIDDYVVYYLNALAQCDCDIIFITTCNELPKKEFEKINTLCKRIIIKKNRGLDFGAYKCGIASEKNLDQYEKLILLNDSVYGPLFDLQPVINHGDKNQLDMWGATDSYMIKYHIQSYFVVFSRALFTNPLFKSFWDNVCYLGLKNNIIIRYEIGMSQYFLKHRFKLGAYCSCPKLANNIKHDPTHHSWNTLIENHQYPFIKRMLIRNNPHHVSTNHWKTLIEKLSTFNTELITNHLERTTPK